MVCVEGAESTLKLSRCRYSDLCYRTFVRRMYAATIHSSKYDPESSTESAKNDRPRCFSGYS